MRYPSNFSSQTTSANIDTVFRQVRFIHIAFLVSILSYGLLGIFLKQLVMGVEPGFVGLDSSTYSLVLTLFMIANVVLGFVILVILPKRNSIQHLVKSGAMSSAALGQGLAKAHFIRLVLAEAMAVFGLALFFLNGNLLHLFTFIGIALVLMLLIFPRQAEWDEAKTLIEKR